MQLVASRELDGIRAACGDCATFSAGGAEIDLFDVLREPLLLDATSHLLGEGAVAAHGRWRDRLYRWKVLARSVVSPLATGEAIDALAIVRTPNHLLDTIATCHALQADHGWRSRVISFGAELCGAVSSSGIEAVDVQALRGTRPLLRACDAVFRSARLARQIDALRGRSSTTFETLNTVRSTVVRRTRYAMTIADTLASLITSSRPRVILTGNPNSIEGRIAARIAHARSTPSVAIEHGTIYSNDPLFEGCPVDLYCAWGDVSAAALRDNGLAADRIAVTGAPRFDDVASRTVQQGSYVLIATSGAGHMVSLAQHRAFVSALYEAAELEPGVRWVAKLHLKDDPALYREIARNHPRAAIEIVPAKRQSFSRDIFDHLAGATALVTVTSTTALDALVANVPIVAFDVANGGRTRLAYLDDHVPIRVSDARGLAAVARQASIGALPEREIARQTAYRAKVFHGLGHAASNVAQQLIDLAGFVASHRRQV